MESGTSNAQYVINIMYLRHPLIYCLHYYFAIILTQKTMKRVKTEHGEEVIHVCNINTSAIHYNETIICAEDQFGEPIFLNFNTAELLECLNVDRMKEQSIKYIESL